MTEIFGFKYGRLRIQEFLIVYSIIHKRVNREISHTKRSQVLEEMCSLTGIYPIVSKSGLHNDTRGRNIWPLHRNTQPSITASPSSGADKHIVLAFIQKLLVDFLYFPSYILIVRCTVMIGFDIHNIVYLVHNAMPQRVVGTKQHVFVE